MTKSRKPDHQPYDRTLSALSSLLRKSTGGKAKDVLKGPDGIDSFERQLAALSKGGAGGGVDSDDSDDSVDSMDDYEEEHGVKEDETEDDYENEEDYDEMDPRRELELLTAPVEGDDDDEEEEEDYDEEEKEDNDEEEHAPKKSRTIPLADSGSDSDSEDGLGQVKQQLSSYQIKKRRMEKEIAELEQENVATRPWALTGEVRAVQRPTNSLLEEFVDFEHATKVLPEITEAVTESHEQIIRNRIREQAWDDPPVRRLKDEYEAMVKKKKTLNDDKETRSSLAKVYEGEVLKASGLESDPTAKDVKQKTAYAEIHKLYGKIAKALDDLSGAAAYAAAPLPSCGVNVEQ